MSIEAAIYIGGFIAAFGYQVADDNPRIYDIIVCPILWPACLVLQLAFVIQRKLYSGVTDAAT